MRFDILDEYSTLVPFGFGVSKRNRVVQYPTAPAKAVKRGAIANCAGRLKLLLKFLAGRRNRRVDVYSSTQRPPCDRWGRGALSDSRMRSATTAPERNVSAAIEVIADANPKKSAMIPAKSAPIA
jgi:hypothetical protein